jgi:hypothetical protein
VAVAFASPPIVEVFSDLGPMVRPGLLALLRAMHDRCDLRAHDPSGPPVWARLVTSTRVAVLPHLLRDPAVPVVVALGRDEVPRPELARRAAALVVEDRERAATLGASAVAVSDVAIDGAAHPPISPFNRARRRELLALPAELVVHAGVETTDSVPPRSMPTALALAAAAAVSGEWFVTALALGTPIVTDRATAARHGARDGVEVLIGDHGLLDAARRLGADATRATALGRGAVTLFTRVFDARAAAVQVLERLGGTAPFPERRLRLRLDELHTPTLDDRALQAVARGAELAPERSATFAGSRS